MWTTFLPISHPHVSKCSDDVVCSSLGLNEVSRLLFYCYKDTAAKFIRPNADLLFTYLFTADGVNKVFWTQRIKGLKAMILWLLESQDYFYQFGKSETWKGLSFDYT
jgi:hypothetical protein